jgi:hypothetical protein
VYPCLPGLLSIALVPSSLSTMNDRYPMPMKMKIAKSKSAFATSGSPGSSSPLVNSSRGVSGSNVVAGSSQGVGGVGKDNRSPRRSPRDRDGSKGTPSSVDINNGGFQVVNIDPPSQPKLADLSPLMNKRGTTNNKKQKFRRSSSESVLDALNKSRSRVEVLSAADVEYEQQRSHDDMVVSGAAPSRYVVARNKGDNDSESTTTSSTAPSLRTPRMNTVSNLDSTRSMNLVNAESAALELLKHKEALQLLEAAKMEEMVIEARQHRLMHMKAKTCRQKFKEFMATYTEPCQAPTQVRAWLFLGNKENAKDSQLLRDLGVTHIINVAFPQVDCFYPKVFCYHNVTILDSEEEDISLHFDECITFIKEARRYEAAVFVHCIAGVSRSPSIVMAYMMREERMRLHDAYNYIVQRRAIVRPNESFRLQLAQYEIKLFSCSSVANVSDPDWNFHRWNIVKSKVMRYTPPADETCTSRCTIM